MFVFKANIDGVTLEKEITKSSTAGTVSADTYDKVAFVPATTGSSPTPAVPERIFFSDTNFKEGDLVIVDYYIEKVVSEIKITTKDFPSTFLVEGETLFRDEQGRDHVSHVTIGKAKLTADFNMNMKPDGDPSTFKFELEALKPIGKSTDLMVMDIEDDSIN